jgi:hypothetical protein
MVFQQDGYIKFKGRQPCYNDHPLAYKGFEFGSCGDKFLMDQLVSTRGGYEPRNHHLLLTCHTICWEAIGVFYDVNKFMFYCTCVLARWQRKNFSFAIRHLRWVQLVLDGTDREKAINTLAGLKNLEVLHLIITQDTLDYGMLRPEDIINLRKIKGLEYVHVEAKGSMGGKSRIYELRKIANNLGDLMFDHCVEESRDGPVSTSCVPEMIKSSQQTGSYI